MISISPLINRVPHSAANFDTYFILSNNAFKPVSDISNTNDEIEFSRLPTEASEISALTSFVNKASLD